MNTTMRLAVAVAILSGGTVLGARSARADQMPVMVAGAAAADATVRAEALEREARELFSQPDRYEKAAKLLAEAAAEREMGDPVRIRDLHMAARLRFYDGNECSALRLMEQAADEALAVGDVIAAANHYADAAFLAKEAEMCGDALKLAKKSMLLANSPLIGIEDRASILARVQIES